MSSSEKIVESTRRLADSAVGTLLNIGDDQMRPRA